MLDGDSVEYEFHVGLDSAVLHPALGRLAFLIQPDGIRTHYITTSGYERSQLSPENAVVENRYQRGDAPLPLQPGWNRGKVSLSGGMMMITLNGVLVFERPCTGDAPQPFGLFRYVGTEHARVRNVVMRGAWPKTVPPAAEQELASPIVAGLDERLSAFPAVFTHDFSTDGLSREFTLTKSSGGTISANSQGVVMTQPGFDGKWSGAKLSLPFSLKGDFDIEVGFADASLVCDKSASMLLDVYFSDKDASTARLGRRLLKRKKDTLQSMVSRSNPAKKRVFSTLSDTPCHATSGRLRLARRGKVMHFLFAEGDSDVFRLIDSDTLTDAQTRPAKIELAVTCDSDGITSVVWKNVRICAEELYYHGGPPAGKKTGLLY